MYLSELKVQASHVYKWHWVEVEKLLHTRIYYQQHNADTFSFAVIDRINGGYFHELKSCVVENQINGVVSVSAQDFDFKLVSLLAPLPKMDRVKWFAQVFKSLDQLSEQLIRKCMTPTCYPKE